MAFAFGPIEDTNEANVAGPRELLTETWCPASANSFAAVPPMCPAPTIPILIRHHLMRPTKTFEGYGFSDSELHLHCLPETRSRGHGCPGTLLGRTNHGDARAPATRATKPLRLLYHPEKGPMDCLLERVWRGWFRLPHRLHHGVLPGDWGLVASRRSPPWCGRRRDGRERGALGDLLGPPRTERPLADRERDLAAVHSGVRRHDGCAVDGPRSPRGGVAHPKLRGAGHVERPAQRPGKRHRRPGHDRQRRSLGALPPRPGQRHGPGPLDRLHVQPRVRDECRRRGGSVYGPNGLDEHVRADRGFVPHGDRRAGAARPRQCGELDRLALTEQCDDHPRRDLDGRGLLRHPNLPRDRVLRRVDRVLLRRVP